MGRSAAIATPLQTAGMDVDRYVTTSGGDQAGGFPRATAEIPARDDGSLADTTVTLEGSSDPSGPWSLPRVAVSDVAGKPANRDGFVPDGIPPAPAHFRLRADRR